MKHNIFSDLRKPGLIPGESLSLSKKYEFCFRETLIYKMSNRMRNLHKQSKHFIYWNLYLYINYTVIGF